MFKPTETARKSVARIGRLPWKAIVLVVMLLVAVAESAFVVQATTQFGCTWCHTPARAVEEVAAGPHAETACLRCHRTQGDLSLLELNVRAARNLLVQVSPLSDPDPSRSFVPSGTCLSCHESQIVGRLAVANDVRMRHSDVLDARIPCADCHARSLHGEDLLLPSLDHGSCSECHDGKTAGTACEVCHLRTPPAGTADLPGIEAVVHGPGVQEIHGMGDLTTCTTCHARTFCKGCHGVELPHDLNSFPHLHGAQALEANGACVTCHAQRFCDSCHQIEMPHPEGFLPAHKTDVKSRDRAACERCHVPEDCEYCHEAHVHPGIPADVLEQLRGAEG